ncbi:Hrp-dependent type III effector protein [Bosea sp. LC85]|uniref:four-carbon acid sugar kinase family protein n=1 Tax=Bosea sp. LC85 TaxID=1502851 RepID=UPI0004E2EEB4|nr:four-carbon acid sugar kinase family protein [Bosea sp. LC85]KFC63607.1 Hrp-dependent type III effector protein [Bosea sp. LC85]
MRGSGPHYGWYGDDFTGATDTLATLAEQGLRALLFLRRPSAARLEAAGPLDAIGIAGATRTMAPDVIAAELAEVGPFFAAQGVAILHYKCCSTFDSAPHVGSIGAALRVLRPAFANPFLPIIGGQPNLGRYCVFGTLFAASGSNGGIHRIDRHPTMSRHPVTPMMEADLRRHLAAQGLKQIALIDYRSYGGDMEETVGKALAERPDALLFDVTCPADLEILGRLLLSQARVAPLLAVGPSSVAQAFAGAWSETRCDSVPGAAMTRRAGPALALVGSLSPVTRAQVEAASGFARLMIETGRLLADASYFVALREQALSALGNGDVMLVTEPPRGAPVQAGDVAMATGRLLRAVMTEARIARLIVAGGDTSTLAIQSLDIWGLSYLAPCVPGAPLCRAHSDDPRLAGHEIILKGGQMGPQDFFARAAGVHSSQD